MIFIDASLPRTVADELKKVREDVVFKHDIFLPGTDDPIWLRRVGCEESVPKGGLPSPATRTLELVQRNAQR